MPWEMGGFDPLLVRRKEANQHNRYWMHSILPSSRPACHALKLLNWYLLLWEEATPPSHTYVCMYIDMIDVLYTYQIARTSASKQQSPTITFVDLQKNPSNICILE